MGASFRRVLPPAMPPQDQDEEEALGRAHHPSWHSHFSPSTASLSATSPPHSQMCKVPKRTTLKVFVSLF